MSGTPVDAGGVRDDGGHLHEPLAAFDKYFLVSYSYLKTWPQGFPEYYRGWTRRATACI